MRRNVAVTLDGSGSTGPARRMLTYRWEQTGGPTVALAPSGSGASFTAPDAKAHLVFTLFVSDGVNPEVSDTVVVDVDTPPVADAGPDRTVMSARVVALDAGQSYDPDDEPLTFVWTQTSGPSVTLAGAQSPVATFTAPPTDGAYGFQVRVCDGTAECANDTVTITIHRYVEIAAGWYHVVALRSDGTVWTWGEDQYGDLGVGPTNGGQHSSVPLQVPGLSNVAHVWAGTRSSYAVTQTGVTYAWGINCYGEAGYARQGASGCDTIDTPKEVDAGFQGFVDVARSETGLYVSPSHVLTAIGYNASGELGTCPPPYSSTSSSTVPGSWASVTTSPTTASNFSLGIDTTGKLYAWGANNYGQLGNNTTSTGCTAITQVGSATTWSAVSAGQNHAAGIQSGRLYTWGANQTAAGVNTTSPAFHGYLTGYIAVSAADGFTLALRDNGMLYAFGRNSSGQLGFGVLPADPSFQSWVYLANSGIEPPQVGIDSDWGAIATGYDSSYGLKNDGSIWAWGMSGDWIGNGVYPNDNVYGPRRVVDGRVSCGDGVTTVGQGFAEACDDGALNGNPGKCSASCRCPATRVVYVDGSATGANDGTSWANAFTTVQAAVAAAGTCDTIWVADGTYASGNADPAVPVLAMANGTEIYGGFAGYETHFSQRQPRRHVTALDGQGTTYHVVVGADGGMLDGFAIRNGHATASAPNDAGAGLLLTAAGTAPFVVRNVVFDSNVAATGGGGIYAYHGTDQRPLTIDRCAFLNNTARSGGGLSTTGPQAVITGSVFIGNAATSLTATGGQGGAIYNGASGALPTLVNDLFVANSASNAGAAIWLGRQSWTAHLTAFMNTGSTEVFHFESGATQLTGAAMWNPGVANDINAGSVTYSCFATGPAGTGNVTLAANPFDVAGTGAMVRPYLAPTSPCRDAGSIMSTARWFPEWSSTTTTADGVPDTGLPDMGYHWPLP